MNQERFCDTAIFLFFFMYIFLIWFVSDLGWCQQTTVFFRSDDKIIYSIESKCLFNVEPRDQIERS